jgi:hypothetical protein
MSLAEEREQSRRFRIEQAAIRPILTECENKASTTVFFHIIALVSDLFQLARV